MRQIVAAGGRRIDTMFEVPAESSDGEAAGDRTYRASRGRSGLPRRSQPPRRGVLGRDSDTSAEAPAGAACPPTIAATAAAPGGSGAPAILSRESRAREWPGPWPRPLPQGMGAEGGRCAPPRHALGRFLRRRAFMPALIPPPHHRDRGWVCGLRRDLRFPGHWCPRPAERGASTAAATEPAAELGSVGTPVAASAFAAAAVIDVALATCHLPLATYRLMCSVLLLPPPPHPH